MSEVEPQYEDARRAAFDRMVGEYEGPLLRYVARLVRNPDVAQDIVQDTLVRLCRHWKEDLTPCPRLSGWLYRVAHNCAIDQVRRVARRHELPAEQSEDELRDAPAPPTAPPELSEAAERAGRALVVLNVREQQLVILKVYEEKSYKEISAITGLSVGNVGYILHHAMKKLARALRNGEHGTA